MPASYTIDHADRVVRTDSWGILTDSEILDLYARLAADPEFDPAYKQLCDLHKVAQIAASSETLRELANASIFDKGTRRAIVVANDLDYGLARMFQTYCDLAGVAIEIFREREAAVAWLGVSSDTAAHDRHRTP